MTRRSRFYFKWEKHLKHQELELYNHLSYKLEYDQAIESFIDFNLRQEKMNRPLESIKMWGNKMPIVEGESFMGLIPYIQAKIKGEPVSEFQHRCWMYGSGQERRNEDAQRSES